MSQTVADLLEHARVFHRRLADFYAKQEDEADKQRVKLVLEYLSRHERHMTSCLAARQADTKPSVAGTWYKHVPDDHVVEAITEAAFRPGMSVDEVLQLALRLDESLLQLYRRLAEGAAAEDVRNLFGELLAMETKERDRMVRDAVEVNDL